MASLILASQSPRRQQLLQQAEIDFVVEVSGAAEDFDERLSPSEVAISIAQTKAKSVAKTKGNALPILAADTVVVCKNIIFGKPANPTEAIEMLTQLQGCTHQVITGVCLITAQQEITFAETTEVTFNKLTQAQIEHYVTYYQPFDKAGGYAIQEWIGLVGIKCIKGDFYNVMGLPIQRVVQMLASL